MKKHILLYLLITIACNFSFAGENDHKDGKNKDNANSKIISGKVVDVNSKEEIAGAEIIIAGQKAYTDLSGNFSVVIPTNVSEAVVKYVSYKDSKVKVDPYSYNTLIIEIIPQ